jgi:hypothetical protein
MMDSQQFAFDHTVSRRGFLHTLGMAGGVMASWSATAEPGPLGVPTSANSRLFTFIGGETGNWSITATRRITGDPWAPARKLTVVNGPVSDLAGAKWLLRGVTSNERYVTRPDKNELVNRQEGLGRPDAVHAALIPIRKTAAWWALTQDERRSVFEEQSHHTAIGLKFLPAVARRLHHSRDLGTDEPFDFLTWFEFSKSNADAFDGLLADLRATKEWTYVERETEIRLVRD